MGFKTQTVKLEPELWSAFRAKLADLDLSAQDFLRAKIVDLVGDLPESLPVKPIVKMAYVKPEIIGEKGILDIYGDQKNL